MLVRYWLVMTSYYNVNGRIEFLNPTWQLEQQKINLRVLFSLLSTGLTSSFATAAKQLIKDCW